MNIAPSTLNQCDIKAIVELSAPIIKLKKLPKIIVKDTRKGRAHLRKGYFTVPKWAWNYGDPFVIQYVIHELCHFRYKQHGHDNIFKRGETKVLQHWNIRPVYARAYVRELYDITTGQKVFSWK